MNPHFRLRQLPFPAKLVVTAFLLSVGLGYFSAMVQLHMKHSARDGNPLPGPKDVIEVFAGLKAYDPDAEMLCACMDRLIAGDIDADDVTKDNMAPAFKIQSAKWDEARGRNPEQVNLERDGERQAMLAWVRLKDLVLKKASYEDGLDGLFPLPNELKTTAITKKYVDEKHNLKIRLLINDRCQRCHKEQVPDLGDYDKIAAFANPPSQEVIAGKWVRSDKQTSFEKLTQSTHAHLLTFSILFGLTGIVFAFTSFPAWVRCIVAPVVLIAQVADVSCWWLARIPAPYGPNFALAIMGTGAVVGIGLSMHIVLSLWNMYDTRGKAVVMLLLFGGALGFGYLGFKVIKPALDDEERIFKKNLDDKKAPPPVTVAIVPKPMAKVGHLEQLLSGPRLATKDVPFNKNGTMVPALFEKSPGFNKALKENPKLEQERDAERLAFLAWVRLDDAARSQAYQDDKMPMPKELTGKPFTDDYLSDGAVTVKSLIEARCGWCHASGAEQEDYPLENYEQLKKYFAPKK